MGENQTNEGLTFAELKARADAEALAAEVTTYYYYHEQIRNYSVGEFNFENHILAVVGDAENARWLRLFGSLPARERAGIVEYHPEVLSTIKRPVGSGAQVGAATTDSVADPKLVQQAGADAATKLAALMKK